MLDSFLRRTSVLSLTAGLSLSIACSSTDEPGSGSGGALTDAGGAMQAGGSSTGGASGSGGAAPGAGGAVTGGDATVGGGDGSGGDATPTGGADGSGGGSAGGCEAQPVCERFESGIGEWSTKGTAPMIVSEGRAGQGMKAGPMQSYIQNSAVFPSPTGKVHVRAYMKWDAAIPDGHTAFVTLGQNDDVGRDLRFGSQAKSLHFNAPQPGDGLSPNPFEYPMCSTCYAPPVGEWVCVELMFDWTNRVAALWVGEEEKFRATDVNYHSGGTPTWPEPPSVLRIGHEAFGGDAPVTYDDLAIGYDTIGCE